MTKFGTVAAILLFIVGGWYYFHKTDDEARKLEIKKKEIELKMKTPGTVVYAVRDVPVGKILSTDDVIEKQIPQSKIPSAALLKSADGVGRLVGYYIAEGQIISGYDFDPPLPGLRVKIVVSSRALKSGTIIKRTDLVVKRINVPADGKLKPEDAIRTFEAVIGKKLKTSVGKEEVLSRRDFY